MVEVMGATITVCSSGITSRRLMITTGRRLSGALNQNRKHAPRPFGKRILYTNMFHDNLNKISV